MVKEKGPGLCQEPRDTDSTRGMRRLTPRTTGGLAKEGSGGSATE